MSTDELLFFWFLGIVGGSVVGNGLVYMYMHHSYEFEKNQRAPKRPPKDYGGRVPSAEEWYQERLS
jgi:hypothetical protein